jgi:hypothetical protein
MVAPKTQQFAQHLSIKVCQISREHGCNRALLWQSFRALTILYVRSAGSLELRLLDEQTSAGQNPSEEHGNLNFSVELSGALGRTVQPQWAPSSSSGIEPSLDYNTDEQLARQFCTFRNWALLINDQTLN